MLDPGLVVPTWVWLATVGGILAILAVDLGIAFKRGAHTVSTREAATGVGIYTSLAVLFAVGMFLVGGKEAGAQFTAGYITELTLSVDNLFVFVIILASFKVPAIHQQKVLLFGIVLALVFRGIFILLGAEAIERAVWVFFLFGAFLIYTAVKLASGTSEQEHDTENGVVRLAQRFLPTTTQYHGAKVTTVIDGKRFVTPMLLVMIAIGSTDILFALDSIPAIFGITEEPYIVFTANAFALMGLRQMFFLIDGLLGRLVYLSYGLAIVLGFIGVKLLLHAAHAYSWGKWAPEIGTFTSLGVIVSVLSITVALSLRASKRADAVAGNGPDLPPAA